MKTQIQNKKLHEVNTQALRRGKQRFVEAPELKEKKLDIHFLGGMIFVSTKMTKSSQYLPC